METPTNCLSSFNAHFSMSEPQDVRLEFGKLLFLSIFFAIMKT